MSAINGAMAFRDFSSGPRKQQEIRDLLQKLRVDLEDPILLPLQRSASLEQLKVYSRDVQDAAPLYTEEAVQTLARHSFDNNESLSTSREALRCLANIFLLKPTTRQIFVDLEFAPRAAERLKVDDRDDEFLISRILFLMTYDTTLDFDRLLAENQLGESINANILRYQRRTSRSARKASMPDPMSDLAFAETLKLMFNINHFYSHVSETFLKSVTPLLKILHRMGIPTPALQPPMNYVINALTNIDLDDKKLLAFGGSHPMFPGFDKKCNAEQLIGLLGQAAHDYPETQLDEAAAPLLTLIRKVYSIAPENVQKAMQALLLPADEERNQPLGKSDSLPSRLLRLSTSPSLPTLRTSISALMFELSDKDAQKFVQNVGYGFAAGFLMNNGLSIPANASEAFSNSMPNSGQRSTSQSGTIPINPITGQRLDAEPPSEEPQMTDAEKEREAERLFVLFERLRANGVLNVENPVRAAVQSGRFEELPD